MLGQKYRFHGHASLRFTYKNGRVWRGQYFTLKHTLNPRRKTPRVAVVVSKKVLKSAVGRNTIRRRLYELFRVNIVNFHANTDVVCIVTSSELATLPAPQLQQLFEDAIEQANLYKNPSSSGTI